MNKDEEKVIYRTGPGGVVEVLRTSRKITFVCTNCGCHFRVPMHLAPECQTGMNICIVINVQNVEMNV